MSREQGPRFAGMRPAANTGSDRYVSFGTNCTLKEEAV